MSRRFISHWFGRATGFAAVLAIATTSSITLAAGPASSAAAPAISPTTAALGLESSGTRIGLCVHLGCGRQDSAGLTADLAAGGNMLVHGLAPDDASLTRARKAIEARGVSGQAMVEKCDFRTLPYLNDLANEVVIEDFDSLAKLGLTMEEVLRITAPEGSVRIYNYKDGKWARIVKPRPAEMDDWRQPLHSADGIAVSNDRVLKMPMSVRWVDGLVTNVTGFAATRAWVIALGKLYSLGINEPENLAAGRKPELWLSARDAFNGLPLWKMNLGVVDDGYSIGWDNFGPLVADEHRVYTALGGAVIGVEGGKTVQTLPTKYPPVRLAMLDNILLAACWEGKEHPTYTLWKPTSDNGTIEAFDVTTGKSAWSIPGVALSLLAADGVVYAVQQGDKGADSQILAVDLKTGKEKWRVACASLSAAKNVTLVAAGKGFVIAHKQPEALAYVLSAGDGKLLWQIKPAKYLAFPVVDGLLWYGGKKFDPLTGAVKGSAGANINYTPCRLAPLVPALIGASTKTAYDGWRPSCVEGTVPANGLLITAQHNCRCLPGAMQGFLAVGPSDPPPTPAQFEAQRPLEKGPAYGKAQTPVKTPGDDWPTYRANAARSASNAAQLPDKLEILWTSQVVPPAQGAMAAAWKSQLVSCLSAPVVADGRVFACGTDTGQVFALDAAGGKTLWTAALPSRIDTPPTVHEGLCLVGCHDGWLYALDAADGQLAWRARVAPLERRIVAFGQVESSWPVAGNVMVAGDTVYASAGRSSETEGGVAVVAFETATGRQLWARCIQPGAHRLNDLLVLRDSQVGWRYIRMDPKTGKSDSATTVNLKDYGGGAKLVEGAIHDGCWTVLANRRSGNAFKLDISITANMMAWNDALAVTGLAAFSRQTQERLWSLPVGRYSQVEAIALAGNAAVLAGRVKSGQWPNFLWVLSSADGTKIEDITLDSPPTYDGLAVAAGRVYVSLQNGKLICLGRMPTSLP